MTRIADLHTDTVLEIEGGADLRYGNPHGHVDLKRLQQGGVVLQTMACFIPSVLPQNKAFQKASDLLDLCYRTGQQNEDRMQIVEYAGEAEQAAAMNKVALLLAVENGYALENDLHNLELLRRRKVRYLTLTHAHHLDWALSSAQPRGDFSGLTKFGIAVIAAMNELDIIADLSHVHETTFWSVIKVSRKPVIASHSNAAGLCPIPRNLKDDQIRAIAGTGGIIGINFYPAFLDPLFYRRQEERCGELFGQLDEMEREFMDDPIRKVQVGRQFNRKLQATMADTGVGRTTIVDHVEYIIRLVGDDFVGFGSDMDGIPLLPEGISGCDDYPVIIDDLRSRGFTQSTIEKICYKNILRILGGG